MGMLRRGSCPGALLHLGRSPVRAWARIQLSLILTPEHRTMLSLGVIYYVALENQNTWVNYNVLRGTRPSVLSLKQHAQIFHIGSTKLVEVMPTSRKKTSTLHWEWETSVLQANCGVF